MGASSSRAQHLCSEIEFHRIAEFVTIAHSRPDESIASYWDSADPACEDLTRRMGEHLLGDLSIQGNIKSVRSLAEPLQVAIDNGARRALVPLENKRDFLEVSADIMERVDPIFFSDPMTAAMKALGMT